MSGSDRSKHTKAGLITGFICAALMVAVFIGWGLLESTKYQREADYQASEHAKYTSDKVAQTCIGIARAKRFECVGEAIATQRDTERNEQDLVAQRQSALWAYIMGSAAVIGMGLSAIGVFLVWTTFRETRLANEISGRSHIEQTASLRPLMHFDLDSFEMWAHPRESRYNSGNAPPHDVPVSGIRLDFDFRNYGQQPCWIESTWIGFFVSRGDEIPPDQVLQFRGATVGFVIPNGTAPGAGAIYSLPQQDLDILNSEPRGIVIFGVCQYRSPSGNLFSTRFAYHVNVGKGRAILGPAQTKEHWRDGRIKTPKMELHEPIEYLD